MNLYELSFLINDIYLVDEKVEKIIPSAEKQLSNKVLDEVSNETQKFDFERFITKNKVFLIVLKNKDDIYIKNAKNELALSNIMKAVATKQILVKENEVFTADNCCFINSQDLINIVENDLTGETTKGLNNYLGTTNIQKIFIFDEDLIEVIQKLFSTKNNSKENLEKNIYLSEIILDKITLLHAHSITEIEKNIQNKKALWKELQVMYEI